MHLAHLFHLLAALLAGFAIMFMTVSMAVAMTVAHAVNRDGVAGMNTMANRRVAADGYIHLRILFICLWLTTGRHDYRQHHDHHHHHLFHHHSVFKGLVLLFCSWFMVQRYDDLLTPPKEKLYAVVGLFLILRGKSLMQVAQQKGISGD